ncbi:prolyl oligopeptidase family serine peptidase [Alphaproteobacteria bacterium]|nr:prolyl oligopeptidase family serine peptidase [Alphaproteobacteria bacterium]
MKKPILEKVKRIKSCHGFKWQDNYSWIHQKNILDVLKDGSKLDKKVRKYLEEENKYTDFHLKNIRPLQKTLFREIKGRIKLDNVSLPFKDTNYEYWTKTTKSGNYSIRLRKKIDSKKIEIYWDGNKEHKLSKSEYFGIGDLAVSYNDKLLGYSLDLKGSEYFTIYIRQISNNKLVSSKINDTSGNIIFSLDDKYIFYSKLDNNHRPKTIFRHEIGTPIKNDILIFEEKNDRFTVGIDITSDEKYFIISSGDHTTSEVYYFLSDDKAPKPQLFQKAKEGIIYSINSWGKYFYIHTNYKAEDFKICKCLHNKTNNWKDVVPAKDEVLVGGFTMLNNWMIRSETINAIPKIFVKNLLTNKEEELLFTEEEIYSPGISLKQKNRNTNEILISYNSPKTPERVYSYNLKNKNKKLIKEQEVPSGHNRDDYIVERLECSSHDGRKVPLTITRHKDSKLDGSSNVLLYGYGSYGSSMGSGFSSTRLSLVNRDIIWVTAHIRGGMEKGMKWWKEGKMLKKKNTFHDYVAVANYLIKNKYTSKKKIIGMGGSAGGLLMGAVVNQAPELFLGIIMAVPFVDSLTTNLDHSLPLTIGEFKEFGNAKKYKKHFNYIFSYAPYNNIKKMEYPHMLITTSLSDNRVLFDEPAKYTAKLRDFKTDNNILLLKTEMEAGHGGKSGRDGQLEEIALDYAFAIGLTKNIL